MSQKKVLCLKQGRHMLFIKVRIRLVSNQRIDRLHCLYVLLSSVRYTLSYLLYLRKVKRHHTQVQREAQDIRSRSTWLRR